MTDDDTPMQRLSDRIMHALELSIEQKDIEISELLVKAIDMAMTRCAGGGEFVERRHYSEEFEKYLEELEWLKSRQN